MTEPAPTGPTPQPDATPPGAGLAALLARPGPLCVLLALVTLAVFWPLKNCDFISCDDPRYILSNPHVRQGLTLDGVSWAFGAGYASNWHPLTWLSHMLDVELFGLHPGGAHLVNLLLHVANSVLLFVLLRELTGAHWRSAWVAALFALHPLHVESVAWISERKDVLSTLFWMLTLLLYGRYVRESKVQGPQSRVFYGLALGCFVLGLMSKPMVVSLPGVLLLLDYWPLGRWNGARGKGRLRILWGLMVEKTPFLVLSGLSCAVTLMVQSRVLGSVTRYPMAGRVENAFVSYGRYLGKMLWPEDLALPYPYPGQWPLEWVGMAGVLVLGLSVGAVWVGRKLPFVVTGWYWFIGTLLPVIGLVQVGTQSMADRYTYVPLVGLFIVVAWGAEAALARGRIPWRVGAVAGAVVVGACALRTMDQLRYWRNSETLFRHTLALTSNNSPAYDNLGYYLYDHGRWEEAIQNYHQALKVNPADPVAYDDLGFCLYNQSRVEEAITNYERALSIKPDDVNALNNLGTALTRRKQFPEAIRCFEAALRLRPDYPDAHNNLGVVLDGLGKTEEAVRQYRLALRFAPDDVQAHNNLANALLGEGKDDEAIHHYRQALQLDPDFTQALNNLGWALAGHSRYGEAIACYNRALQLKPDDEMLHKNLGKILDRMGRNDEAIGQYTETLRLAPDDAEAHYCLGGVLARSGRRDEAVAHLTRALRLRPGNADIQRALQALGVTASE
jgi:tetratricopeptide (TPR) repeat protein